MICNLLQQISAHEEGVPSRVFRTRRKSQEDSEYNVHGESNVEQQSQSPTTARQKCHVCRKVCFFQSHIITITAVYLILH